MLEQCNADIKILDYTNTQLIVLGDGIGKIQNGTLKLIHIIDIQCYINLTNTIEQYVHKNITIRHPLHLYLLHDIDQIHSLIKRIHPRVVRKRSLDFIGTTIKWLAGNPDHQDLEIINGNIDNLVNNNNNQIIINRKTVERINELSSRNNEILASIKGLDNIKFASDIKTKLKLEIIKEDLKNIEYALHWAKSGIVNSFILSDIEINSIERIMKESNGKFTNIDEQLEFSTVKVAINETCIFYIVSIPISGNNFCENLKLIPVKKNNVINKISHKKILKCNNDIFGIVNECKNFNDVSLCKSKELVNLNNDPCIKNLLTNVKSNCTKINANHITNNEELEPGMLLLNDFNGNITVKKEITTLQGTFIIIFKDTTVEVGTMKYTSKQTSNYQPLPALLQPWGNVDNIEQILSLEMMRELHINNTKHIEAIKRNKTIETTIHISLYIILITTTAVLIIKIFKCNRGTKSKKAEEIKITNVIAEQIEIINKDIQTTSPTQTNENETKQTGTFAFGEGGVNTVLCHQPTYPKLFTFAS